MKIVIPGNPITKKNSQRIVLIGGKPRILPSKNFKEYEARAALFMPKMKFPIIEAVNVKCLYYMETHRRVDLCNLMEATHDILVRYGILEDDNSLIVWAVDGSRVLYDKEHPRVEIEITPIGEVYGN